MHAFFASPAFLFLALLLGFLAGWLVREAVLMRRFNIRLAQTERDRDFARTELETALEKGSLAEADRKKAAFDAAQFAGQTDALEADNRQLLTSLSQADRRIDDLLTERESLEQQRHSQAEQILGLRAQNRQLTDAAEFFSEKEAAEKRLRTDFGDALRLATELQKQVARLRHDAELARHEKEVLKTQLLDYQLRTVEFPGISAANGKHESAKKAARKKAAQQADSPVEMPAADALPDVQIRNPQSKIRNQKSAIQNPQSAIRNREALPDDLKLINGISNEGEKELEKLGITSIHHLAGLSENQLLEFAEGSRRLVEQLQKEDWIGQARHLVRLAEVRETGER